MSLEGLGLSNGTDADNDIDIAVGICKDAAKTTLMALTSILVKQIDVAWVAGSAAGGLFSGVVANSTWYHVFLIQKDSDNSIDGGFDTSVTAANIPAGYTAYRRLGSVLTNGSATIIKFSQNGDEFLWDVLVKDEGRNNPGTDAVTVGLSTPLGVRVRALLFAYASDNTASAATALLFTAMDTADTIPTASLNSFYVPPNAGANSTQSGFVALRTDTSSQIRYRQDSSTPDHYTDVFTHGWLDSRGKDG